MAIELAVTTRTLLGKKTKNLRKEGFISAEIYGQGIGNQHVSIPVKTFNKIYKEAGENTVVTVVTDDGKKIPVFINDVSRNMLTGELLSVDLHAVRMDEKIKAKIPVEFTGVAPALKLGHIIVKVLHEIEVEALPGNMPHRFEIDLSTLENPGQTIQISNIKISKDVKIMIPEDTVVVTVNEKAKEEVVAPPPTATTEAAAPATGEAATAPASEEPKEKTAKK